MNQEGQEKDTTPSQRVVWRRVIVLLGALAIAWVLWSWLFKPLLLWLGVFSCLLVIFVVHRMDYFRSENYALRMNLRLPLYWAWLLKEIFKSSLMVARVIIDPKLPISPRTIEIDAEVGDQQTQTIYANSITLTPGSLALDVHKGVIKVHTLTEEVAADLADGEMARRIRAIRGD